MPDVSVLFCKFCLILGEFFFNVGQMPLDLFGVEVVFLAVLGAELGCLLGIAVRNL